MTLVGDVSSREKLARTPEVLIAARLSDSWNRRSRHQCLLMVKVDTWKSSGRNVWTNDISDHMNIRSLDCIISYPCWGIRRYRNTSILINSHYTLTPNLIRFKMPCTHCYMFVHRFNKPIKLRGCGNGYKFTQGKKRQNQTQTLIFRPHRIRENYFHFVKRSEKALRGDMV